MAVLLFIFGLIILITFSRTYALRKDVDYLQEKVQDLSSKLLHLENGKPLKKAEEKSSIAETPKNISNENEETEEFDLWEEEEPVKTAKSSAPRVSMAQKQEAIKSTFEQNIATKAPVWIGAISLICAAFFLVKYSIEAGLLGPEIRITMGGIFGIGLLFAGQWVIKRPKIANAQRIAQGLIGAGLVSLYGTLYAATNLHDMIPSLAGFIGMVIVTGIAIITSLRHGQPIAVFGIIGGLLTPALIGSEDPNLLGFLIYLFVLFSGIFVVLVRQGWWILAILALVGSLAWSFLWIATQVTAPDVPILILFSMGLTAVILSATGRRISKGTVTEKEKLPLHTLNGLSIAGGLGTIVWLGFKINMGLFEWGMIGLLSLALNALAYFDPKTYEKPLAVKMGATLAILFFWLHDQSFAEAFPIIIGLAVIYIGLTGYIMRRVKDPRFWAIAQTLSTLGLYLISFFALDMPYNITWGILCLGIAALAIFQISQLRKNSHTETIIQDHLIAIYALTASAFISIGLTTELPFTYAPLAIAGQIAATAWIYKKTVIEKASIDALQKIMILLAFVFIGMNYEQIFLFLGIAISSLLDETLSAREIKQSILSAPIIQLGVSSALMYLAYWLTPRNKTEINERLVKLLFIVGTALALWLAYHIFRTLVHGGIGEIFELPLGFIHRGIFTIAIGLTGIAVLHIAHTRSIPSLEKWANGLFALAMFRLVYFDMMLHNPYFSSSQLVGEMILFNGVTLTYGLGTIMALWMAHNYKAMEKPYGIIALVSLFAFGSLTVRHYFHGSALSSGEISSAELYSYSVAWLIMGVGLLTSGIRFDNKSLRMVSLAFMLLTVCKVFLIDAAELEGLLRVISFLGLGVSLIGLSTFYTKFVFRNELADKKA